jgi:release factor glutamine methyltransferase
MLPPNPSVAEVLTRPPIEALEARILLQDVLKLSRVQLITQSERILTDEEASQVRAAFARRLNGEPIAYIVGKREFYGLSFDVSPEVLIPRPETELLVELVRDLAPPNARVLDMGTGSGAIAVALVCIRADLCMAALDASDAALKVARRNAVQHNAPIAFRQSDWYAGLDPDQQFDVIVSNPPYIAAVDRHLSQGDLRFEPRDALTDHADGLAALRIIAAGALRHLVPGGRLLVEHGYDQAPAVRTLLAEHGFREVRSWQDLAGIERATGGVAAPALHG